MQYNYTTHGRKELTNAIFNYQRKKIFVTFPMSFLPYSPTSIISFLGSIIAKAIYIGWSKL